MIYTIIIILAVIFLFYVINLAMKNKLDLGFSLFWGFFAIVAVIFSFNVTKIGGVAEFVGVIYPPSLVFTCFIGFLCLYVLKLSMIVSKQNKKITRMTQKLSILEEKVPKIKEKNGEKNEG